MRKVLIQCFESSNITSNMKGYGRLEFTDSDISEKTSLKKIKGKSSRLI